MNTRIAKLFLPLLITFLVAACSQQEIQPAEVACDNSELTAYDGLLIVAPHPDDEVLGFSGLADAFIAQGKPVRTIVVTDGDAYCDACSLWTTGSVMGATCDALTLSNLDTPEVDSLAEVRREESRAAAAILGRPAPEFLTYPDTGLGAARRNLLAGEPGKFLHRSDFSQCESCGDCSSGYGTGPTTQLSANTLIASLDEVIGATTPDTLIATTHWLDGHGDHAALGAFVGERAAAAEGGHTVAFAVIHANSSNGYGFADCWYPGPAAVECPCFDEERADRDPQWLQLMRAHRERPDLAQQLPTDADYGEPVQLGLGATVLLDKPPAIDAFQTQLGTVGIAPGILPEQREGMLDCSAYLRSFGRRTEVFVVREFPE